MDVMVGYRGKGTCLTLWFRELHAMSCDMRWLWRHETAGYPQAKMLYESGTDRAASCNQIMGISWMFDPHQCIGVEQAAHMGVNRPPRGTSMIDCLTASFVVRLILVLM